jgi:hypothetical protein
MYSRVSVILSAALLWSASGHTACPPGQTRDCINLDAVPEISKQIVAREPVAPAAKPQGFGDATTPYTGPTVGVSDKARRAPTVGYRWAIN